MEEKRKLNITQAAELAKVGRQAIFQAIKKGRLKAYKPKYFWEIYLEDLEQYRIMKYSRQNMVRDGHKVFSEEKGTWSVIHVCKTLSEALGRPYTPNRIYYLIRRGNLPAYKCGAAWVILSKDAEQLLEMELGRKDLMKRGIA